MIDKTEQTKQRDRFLAFAFACADFLLEIDANGIICFASGAAKKITSKDNTVIQGMKWLDLFHDNDRAMVKSIQSSATHARRCGPVLVHLNPELGSKLQKVVLTAIKMPDKPDHFYVTLTQGSGLSSQLANKGRDNALNKALSADEFAKAALQSISNASALGQDLDITFLELPTTELLKSKMGDEKWDIFKNQLTGMLKGASIDGQTASELSDGKFSLLHEKNTSIDLLKNQIKALSKESDPDGKGIDIDTQTIEAKEDGLSEREFAKALVYTISKFEEKGNDLTLGSINEGFESFLKENEDRISHLKSIINQQRFNLAFQPIVDLNTGQAHHYEALVRFQSDKSPYEIITFGEDIGLAPQIDMMICSKALSYVLYNLKKEENISIAVNLSAISIQKESFIQSIRSKFEPHLKSAKIADRIMFEITESSQIKDLKQVGHFVDELRKDGFKVWLDDFGAGAASFQYLQGLNVDGVKIDGQYIDQIQKSERDQKLVKNLVSMCHDLGIKTVAERVETKKQLDILKDLNMDFGQGYYFAKPDTSPHYKKK